VCALVKPTNLTTCAAEISKSASLVLRFGGALCLLRRGLEEAANEFDASNPPIIGPVKAIDMKGGVHKHVHNQCVDTFVTLIKHT